ncbi:DNA starvation/stationary phase protection protein, partial [Bifidobacterium sp. M0404]|nr:DNA starvation/stationary phase protection protein [Bifidobacterium sp. M0404]
MALNFTVPGLDEATSEKVIAILQSRLSQEQETALILKHAHWNMKGKEFIGI